MKVRSGTTKQTSKVNLRTSTLNLFYNLIIFILGIFIIFLAYSLYIKIINNEEVEKELANKKAAAAIVQLEVLNGCGVSGVADKFTDFLRSRNFDVVQTGNYISFNIDRSMVIDRTGNIANAEKVAEALGIEKKNIIQQINNDYLLDVSLIIGKDFNNLKPKF